MKIFVLWLVLLSSVCAQAASQHEVTAAVNDETFIINGEVFKAKTYCFNFEKGDKVIFTSGSASGVCTSAEFVNLRTGKVCKAWCE